MRSKTRNAAGRPPRGESSPRPRHAGGNTADRQTGPATEAAGELVLVRFKGNRKASFHNQAGIKLGVGDYCVVEADRGRDLGRVCYIGPGKRRWWRQARKQGVLDLAGPADLKKLHENRGDEWEFYDICREKIQDHKLDMNLVSVERQFDHNKITFYFTAEKRVDFRDLVRDLAAVFRTRIELRQIGVRDEARFKGGVGICGREFCCSSFLDEFVSVTLKMAKDQQLPLNPAKLSGPCGRLRCCISYEHAGYAAAKLRLPRVGAAVKVGTQPGIVRKLDLLHELVTLQLTDKEEHITVPPAELEWDPQENLPSPRSRPSRRSRRR
jgi:cell fate regulator YaaT (PSP1 superfamily)